MKVRRVPSLVFILFEADGALAGAEQTGTIELHYCSSEIHQYSKQCRGEGIISDLEPESREVHTSVNMKSEH